MPAHQALPVLRLKNWKNLDAHLVWIYEGAPQIPLGTSLSDCYSAWYLKAGSLRLDTGRGKQTVEKGRWVLFPPGELWREFSPDARLLSIHFEAQWTTGQLLFQLSGALVPDPARTRGWLAPTAPMLRLVRRHYPTAFNTLGDAVGDYAVYANLQGHFQHWLARVWAGVRGESGLEVYLPPFSGGRALEMKRWLDRWPLHEPFRQGDMARAFHLSVTHANRLFCAAFEVTPKRYLNQRRLGYAVSALRSSSRSIKEVAHATGFRHLPEFSSWFRERTGQSPSAFRRSEA